ncbi:FAD-dependent monooxygenase [Nocardia jejuensis]|uniref:FAD-dependent monooxygenase n=1 Tax=Nocardia jejuensis TaxID=328049 RepID=UPI0008324AB1|nr:FAD-dependent monooxygenase [Nocardia jejuensis]
MSTSVLISGAGIGGSTLAYWLGRNGFDVTVVERAAGQRSSGNPIDVRGPALDVVERMGVMPALRKAATGANRLSFLDGAGGRRAWVAIGNPDRAAVEGEVELARADLASVLLDAARPHADIRWGDTITGLTSRASGVDVSFGDGDPATYDYVIGADGLHSNVRNLAFGPEREFVRHMGMYVATLRVDRAYGGENEVVMHNTPGRSLSVHPAGGKPLAAFIFRRSLASGVDHRDLGQHKNLVLEAFEGRAGIFGALLDQVRAAEDMYFDSVSRVRLRRWSTGRTALLGDAASSVSLFGEGSSLAIAGAHTLAEELTRSPGDPGGALGRYERRHRTLTGPKQRAVRLAAAMIVPGSRLGIRLRDTAVRFMPGM